MHSNSASHLVTGTCLSAPRGKKDISELILALKLFFNLLRRPGNTENQDRKPPAQKESAGDLPNAEIKARSPVTGRSFTD